MALGAWPHPAALPGQVEERAGGDYREGARTDAAVISLGVRCGGRRQRRRGNRADLVRGGWRQLITENRRPGSIDGPGSR